MYKSDLEARPIYNFKEEATRSQGLICFVAFMVEKCLELTTKDPEEYQANGMEYH